jgi:uncharacterized protein YneF (UPF0154 family)
MGLTAALCGIIFGTLGGIALGIFLGMRIASSKFKKHMKENPVMSEQQIRMMYSQMGRKPSESQVKQIMNNLKNGANK